MSTVKVDCAGISDKPALTPGFFKHPGRLEAFSDGVFAIAVTLLMLELRIPPVDRALNPPQLWQA